MPSGLYCCNIGVQYPRGHDTFTSGWVISMLESKRLSGSSSMLFHPVCPRGASHTSLRDIGCIANEIRGKRFHHRALRAMFHYHPERFDHGARKYPGGIAKPHVSSPISCLFDFPLFSRALCMQELLSTDAASLHAGPGCIQWKELRTISSWLASDDFRGKEPHIYPSQVSTPGT
jgi:hypothetical protein